MDLLIISTPPLAFSLLHFDGFSLLKIKSEWFTVGSPR